MARATLRAGEQRIRRESRRIAELLSRHGVRAAIFPPPAAVRPRGQRDVRLTSSRRSGRGVRNPTPPVRTPCLPPSPDDVACALALRGNPPAAGPYLFADPRTDTGPRSVTTRLDAAACPARPVDRRRRRCRRRTARRSRPHGPRPRRRPCWRASRYSPARPHERLPEAARTRLGTREGQRNLLVRMVLRPLDRTLTDPEANAIRDRVYAAPHVGPHHERAAQPARVGVCAHASRGLRARESTLDASCRIGKESCRTGPPGGTVAAWTRSTWSWWAAEPRG